MRILTLLTLGACATKAPVVHDAPPAGRAVWIDLDASVGEPNRDVDDGVALLHALHSPELDIVGISSVFGNAPLDRSHPIAVDLLATWQVDHVVHRGADAPGAYDTEASRALIAALEQGPLTILALGPATNVAAAVVNRPDLHGNITEIIAVAGRRPAQRFTTGTKNRKGHRDFNFEKDPRAFADLLRSGVPLTLAPWEVSSKVWIRKQALRAWSRGERSRTLVPAAEGWLALWQTTFGVDGFNPFDTLATGRLTVPDLIHCDPMHARIERRANDVTDPKMQGTASPQTKPYLEVRHPDLDPEAAPVRYCHDVEADAFVDHLQARLLATP